MYNEFYGFRESPFNITPDPLTTVVGRVVDSNGVPVAGAAVACAGESSASLADGTFTVPGGGSEIVTSSVPVGMNSE